VKVWAPLAVLVLAEIGYPLVSGATRAALVVCTVVLGFAVSLSHAWTTRGPRVAARLVAVTAGGGFAVEAVGVATGFPFGSYHYSDALGPRLLGVPLVIPLAWTWMAWPACLAARGRVLVAGLGLAAWDLFLDPQMVAEGYWRWHDPSPALPGVPDVPLTNYLGWFAAAVLMMALLGATSPPEAPETAQHHDAPMLALYLWTYASSVLAHAVFLGLPASAAWGALGMGLVALPLAWKLAWSSR
jgi:putative membrane protein